MNVIEYLNIPKPAAINQRIAIQTMVDAHGLNTSEEKLLRDHIASIYLIAALNENTINVKAYQDEAMTYEEIHMLKIELKQDKRFSQLNQKLHTLFPNPTLIIFSLEGQYIYSASLKHTNKYEQNQAVIEEVFVSEKSRLNDEASKKFLDKTNLKALQALNLKDYYEAIINIIYQQRLVKIIDDYPDKVINALKVKEALKELEMHQTELNKLKEQAASLQTMRSKMENHMRQKNVEKNIDSVIQSIKEAL